MEMIKTMEIVPLNESPQPQTWKGSFMFELQRYSRGEIHDISLKDAEIQGKAPLTLRSNDPLIGARLRTLRT